MIHSLRRKKHPHARARYRRIAQLKEEGWRRSADIASDEEGILIEVSRAPSFDRPFQTRKVWIDRNGLTSWDAFICPLGYVRAADGSKLA